MTKLTDEQRLKLRVMWDELARIIDGRFALWRGTGDDTCGVASSSTSPSHHLDPAVRSRTVLEWVRLLCGPDDELYATAVRDLELEADVVGYDSVMSWERRHRIDVVVGLINAIRRNYNAEARNDG